MKSYKKIQEKAALLLILPIALMLLNCTSKHTPNTEQDNSFYTNLSSTDFPKEIDVLEKITTQHPDPSVQTNAHLQLAMLHLSYKNPNPDYQRALDELEIYIFLDPDWGKKDEIQNWLAVLREIEKLSEENKIMKGSINLLTEENQNLVNENNEMKETIEQLETLDTEMKETIEQLKSLDLRLEEKRKNIK
ncbi:MAG TPA: hypothetical protein VHT73_14070 [Thermodesulfobacteriota bacterium]|nr:hypothetical protein [Thermodesulfobacteriota bacterium]